MAQSNVSWFLIIVIFVLDLAAFGLALGAESRRAKGHPENGYCVYDSDIATGLGVGATLVLISSQFLISATTRCLCCGPALTPGASRLFAIVFFVLSWLSFLIAELCLVVGSARNSIHYKYSGYFGAADYSCSSLRKGTFGAGAAFIFFSFLFSIVYYVCYTKSQLDSWATHNGTETGMGMARMS